jgi:hypothetical protein
MLASEAASEGWQIYGASELSQRESRYHYSTYVTGVFRGDLIGQLPIQERAALRDVKLVLLDQPSGDPPLTIGADVAGRTVYLPIQTVAFIDDLAAVGAWLSRRDCSFEPATLYAGMIAAKPPPAGQRLYPNPREVFGLGDDVWDDPVVKTSSNQISKTAIFFMLAHELGHVRRAHKPYDAISPAEAQRQELEADRYAIEAMRHIGVPPMGMFHAFSALSRMEGVPTTHPLSGARMLQIAEALEQAPGDFVPPDESKSRWAPVIHSYGSQFRTLVPVVDSPILRQELAQEARSADWSEPSRRCPH